MKFFLMLAVTVAAMTAFAASPFRVDINGMSDKGNTKISPASVEGAIKIERQNWLSEEKKPYGLVAYANKTSDQWTTYTFAFKAEEAGRVHIGFGAQWGSTADKRGWIAVTDLKVDGKLLPNGDLVKSYKSKEKVMPTGFWLSNKALYVADGGVDGKGGAALVNHDNRLSYAFNAEAGKTYVFSVQAKTVPAPALK